MVIYFPASFLVLVIKFDLQIIQIWVHIRCLRLDDFATVIYASADWLDKEEIQSPARRNLRLWLLANAKQGEKAIHSQFLCSHEAGCTCRIPDQSPAVG